MRPYSYIRNLTPCERGERVHRGHSRLHLHGHQMFFPRWRDRRNQTNQFVVKQQETDTKCQCKDERTCSMLTPESKEFFERNRTEQNMREIHQ